MLRINLLPAELRDNDALSKRIRKVRDRQRYAKNAGGERARNAAWRKANPEWNRTHVKEWREKNRLKARANADAWRRQNPQAFILWQRKNNSGIVDAHRADAVFAAQGGVCAICGTSSFVRAGRDIKPSADHDHSTGLLRGMLCGKCNPGLGLFNDDPSLLRTAAWYLEHPPAQTNTGDDLQSYRLW